jgi:hypothetical protein
LDADVKARTQTLYDFLQNPTYFSGNFEEALDLLQKKAQQMRGKPASELKKGDWKELKKYATATQKFFENWKADIIAQYPAPIPEQVIKALADIDAQLTAINACNPCIIENETAATEGEGSPIPRNGPNVESSFWTACEVNFQALENALQDAKTIANIPLPDPITNDDPITLSSPDPLKYIVYLTPAGKPFPLPPTAQPLSKSAFKIPDGTLAGFILNSVKYVGHYGKKNGKLFFYGYAPLTAPSSRYYDAKSDLDWIISKKGDLKEKNSGMVAASAPIGAIALTEQGAVTRLANLVLGTAVGVTLFLATIVSSSEGEKYFGTGEIGPINLPMEQIGKWQTVRPPAIPVALPHAVPKDNGGDCSVYVIWGVKTDGRGVISV